MEPSCEVVQVEEVVVDASLFNKGALAGGD
jgi:hypothetical protein